VEFDGEPEVLPGRPLDIKQRHTEVEGGVDLVVIVQRAFGAFPNRTADDEPARSGWVTIRNPIDMHIRGKVPLARVYRLPPKKFHIARIYRGEVIGEDY